MAERDFNVLTVDCQAPDAPAQVAKSLRETGFAVLHNHPIARERMAAVYGAWRAFFNAPSKHDYLFDPTTQFGYFPFGAENAKDAPVKDLKEFYHVYPHAPLPPQVEAETRAIYADLVALGETVLGWIEDNTPEAVRERLFEPLVGMVQGSAMNLLRVLHYPPLTEVEAEPGAVRAAAHEDINLITLLVSASAPGLQALDADGVWSDIPCDAGAITINAGDMLQMATGGYYPSTTHRVVNPTEGVDQSRYSMPMFIHPRPDARLDAEYTAHDYLNERLREIGLKSPDGSGSLL